MSLDNVVQSREKRAEYIHLNYGKFLSGKVLDIGCRDKFLKKYLSEGDYVGIDISGTPDIKIDLEKQNIPFPDNSFDCVICTDVLEHLNNIHEIFDELLRVSKNYVIISLPNCYALSFLRILFLRGGLKQYGLPKETPADRHKWFFNYDEAEKFIIYRTQKNNAEIVEMVPFYNKRAFRDFILKLIFGRKYRNIAYLFLWTVIKK